MKSTLLLCAVVVLAVITGECRGGRELPEHWVQYLDYLVAQFDLLPCPRPTSIIGPGTLGHPFHTHAEEVSVHASSVWCILFSHRY